MPAVSDLEKELTKATKVKPDKYPERQDYLAGVVRAIEKLSDDDYDSLSDDAATWHTAAVEAMTDREEIPDFIEAEPAEEPDEAPTKAEAEAEDDDPDEAEPEAEQPEDEVEDKPAKKAGRPPKVKAAKVAKEKPEKAEKAEKPKPKGVQVRYTELTGEYDKFGFVKGTKTSLAMEVFEKGATAIEVEEEVGGRFYNALRTAQARGHTLEKMPGNKWKLTFNPDAKQVK